MSGQPEAGAKESFQGAVEIVTYHDPDTLYSVLKLSPEKGYVIPDSGELFASQRATAVGRIPQPAEGMRLRLTGSWSRHPQHGSQFEFEAFESLPPLDEDGLVRYLASKAFEGIGETLAKRIVAALGEETLERIQADPGCLKGIRGLREGVAEKLAAAVRAQLGSHQTHAFLRGLGLGPLQAQTVFAQFEEDCEERVRADPYLLARVPGLGFLTADRVARKMGLADDDPRRSGAAILHVLQTATGEGHTTLCLGEVLERTEALLRGVTNRRALADALETLERQDEVAVDRTLAPGGDDSQEAWPVYLPWLLGCERGVATSVSRLLLEEVRPLAGTAELDVAEREAQIELHPDQRAAVLRLLSVPIALLTGGPGVGKTTIVRLVANLAERAGARIALASPTGRAAKRLAEATGRDASTVHRLLKVVPGAGFEHGAEKPLAVDVVIVDEISMLDVVLAHALMRAVHAPSRLILVGDPDQLPSVGAGNVLRDMLDSGRLPTARLTRIYRQGEKSLIVTNAHRILDGQMPVFPERGDRSADFYFFPADGPAATLARTIDVTTRRIPHNFGHDWTKDVQVIAPMYRGECGVDALNEGLREAQGYGGREVVRGDRKWRVGDRVIHTRNNYDKEVFNGDMGRIVSVSADGFVTVRYPDQNVVYSGGELSDLRPAFAITVHRSQGGEFPVVVLPLVTQHALMLQRNLLYTAVTRARQLVVLVGSRRALSMAVANADQARRESQLAERLRRMA